MINRMHELLKRFSRNESEAKRNKQVNNKIVEPVETYGNGTPGYKLKKGKNAGKILKHPKVDSNNI